MERNKPKGGKKAIYSIKNIIKPKVIEMIEMNISTR